METRGKRRKMKEWKAEEEDKGARKTLTGLTVWMRFGRTVLRMSAGFFTAAFCFASANRFAYR